MAKRATIGIDIGGTKIRGVLLGDSRVVRILEKKYYRKPPVKNIFLTALFGLIDELLKQAGPRKVRAIGLGVPGVVAKNRVWAAGNLLTLNRLDLAGALKKRYRLPLVMDNDVKTAAVAEWQAGAAKGSRSLVMITLGTGVGGAYIANGILHRGAFDSAYEIGFMVIDSARTLRGRRGDFEGLVSEKFFTSRGLDPIKSELLARQGNRRLLRLWREYGKYLGIGIANIANILEPELIVIGGGMAHAWPLFAPSMRQSFKRLVISPLARSRTKIRRATLGRNAGAVGAAIMAQGGKFGLRA